LDANFNYVSASSGVTYTQGGTGATTTTVQSKLRESVSVKDFGAVGNGDDLYLPLTQALAVSNNVYIPAGYYTLSAPILFSGQNIRGAGVGYTSTTSSNQGTIIVPVAGISAFKYKTAAGYIDGGSIEDLFIDFGDSYTSNISQIGINLGDSAGFCPSLFQLNKLRIRGAYYGVKDASGSYMNVFKEVLSIKCRIGFYKQYGTTQTYQTCYAAFCYTGFRIDQVIGVSLNQSAIESCTDTDSNPVLWVSGTSGLVIEGLDQEANVITTPSNSIIKIDNCNGFVINSTSIVTNNINNASGTSYWLLISGTSIGQINGVNTNTLTFNGTFGVGSVSAIGISGTANVNINNSYIPAVIQTVSPAVVYSIDNTSSGFVKLNNCFTGNNNKLPEKLYTPTVTDSLSAGTASYTTQLGSYDVNGKTCNFKAQITLSAYSPTGAGQPYISLPFNVDATYSSFAPISIMSSGITLPAGAQLVGMINTVTNKVQLYTSNAGTLAALGTNATGFATATFYVAGTYLIA
jgi:hypothetical protein